MSKFYGATSLIGGGSGALDAIDGAALVDGDGVVVIIDGLSYFYHLDATSGAGESSPRIISPDANAGTKRWLLVGGVFDDLNCYGGLPGSIGGFEAGMFRVTNSGGEFSNSVITGHNAFNGNTQLWYLGNTSGGNNDIAFINRQNAAMHFYTNNTSRMTIDADGKVTFTQAVSGVAPTAGEHFTTRNYVDMILSAFKTFFLSGTASGIGSLDLAYPHETGEAEDTIVTASLGVGDAQLVRGFITEAGEPGSTTIHAGVMHFHFHAKKGASNHRTTVVYAELYRVDADGTSNKTLVATTGDSPELTDTETGYELHLTLGADIEVADTSRLILDVKVDVGSGAVDSVVTLYMEGVHDSYFTANIDPGLWQTHSDRLDDLATTDATAAELNELTDSSETTLHSHAAGVAAFGRPLVFTAQSNEPPDSNFATLDTRNAHLVLDFALNEIGVFSHIMPRGYAGGGLTVYIHYAMTSAVANDIKLEVYLERIGDQQQDIDSDGFAAAQNSGDITVPGTSGFVDVIPVTFTDGAQMDSIAAGESFRVKVKRIAVGGTDASGDLELTRVEIKET